MPHWIFEWKVEMLHLWTNWSKCLVNFKPFCSITTTVSQAIFTLMAQIHNILAVIFVFVLNCSCNAEVIVRLVCLNDKMLEESVQKFWSIFTMMEKNLSTVIKYWLSLSSGARLCFECSINFQSLTCIACRIETYFIIFGIRFLCQNEGNLISH